MNVLVTSYFSVGEKPSVLLWTALTQALEAKCPHSVNLNEVPLAPNPVRVNQLKA